MKRDDVDPFSLPEEDKPKKLTPEIIKQLLEEGRQAEQKAKDKKRRERVAPKGVCQVCAGLVYAKYGFDGEVRCGGQTTLLEYYCKKCGLKYEFAPNRARLREMIEEGKVELT